MDDNDIKKLYDNILPILELIIIQPISENYKLDNTSNLSKYSTKSILNNINKTCVQSRSHHYTLIFIINFCVIFMIKITKIGN